MRKKKNSKKIKAEWLEGQRENHGVQEPGSQVRARLQMFVSCRITIWEGPPPLSVGASESQSHLEVPLYFLIGKMVTSLKMLLLEDFTESLINYFVLHTEQASDPMLVTSVMPVRPESGSLSLCLHLHLHLLDSF